MCISVEPVPVAYQKLCENVRLNDLGGRVSCYNLGLGGEAGELRFTETKGPENRVVQSDTTEGGIEVQVTTVDDLADEAEVTDEALIAKVDVEGWEAAVIRGGDNIISRPFPTALLLELDGSGARYGFDDDAVHEELLDKGYICVDYDPHRRQLIQRSRRHAGGNTLYVNDMTFFSRRVEQSEAYSVLGKQI
jgi:FkbM family methyltransferase